MTEPDPCTLPPSFIELFVPPGARRPAASRAQIAERYELCEDMAQLLVEPARERLFALGIAEEDVLERIGRGLADADSAFTPPEARWVLRRLAELLGWPDPGPGDGVNAPA